MTSGVYKRIYPTKPCPNNFGYLRYYISPKKRVLIHRYIMEKHLRRKLKKGEVVHHIDENKTNNNISNLRLYKSHSEHMIGHGGRKWLIDWSKVNIPEKIRPIKYKPKKWNCIICKNKAQSRSLCGKHMVSFYRWKRINHVS